MNHIEYVTGDATLPDGCDTPAVIAHVVNTWGKWGAGFVLELNSRFGAGPKDAYRAWHKGEDGLDMATGAFGLGQTQFVEAEPQVWVANMVAQHGVRRWPGDRPLDYDALRTALAQTAEFAAARHATLHMPRIGTGLAGGRWDVVGPMVSLCAKQAGVQVTVYDLHATAPAR
jgi:O-acetyl-ADP-ribose deacetylase (regulator of RNase III)